MSRRRFNPLLLTAALVALVVTGCDHEHGHGSPSTPTPRPTSTPAPPTEIPTPSLVLSSIYPLSGPPPGDNPVALQGRGFGDGPVDVFFAENAAHDCIVVTDQNLSCRAPEGLAGRTVNVSVRRPGVAASTLLGGYRYTGGGSGAAIDIETSGLPTVLRDRDIGTTSVVLDYLVRDVNGRPIDPADLEVVMYLDGNRLGEGIFDEAVLQQDARELELNLFLMLVLDASFSLQTFDPPQFTAMLESAEALVRRGADIWDVRAGDFNWSIVWFDELLAKPHPDFRDSFRIINIPPPGPGNFTKLYSAISSGLETSASFLDEGVAAGPRDRHVMVVFTDGKDNLSDFDNHDFMTEDVLQNGDPFPRYGWRATDLDAVLREITEHPRYPSNLTVHTIALGENCDVGPEGHCFDQRALGQIAQVGLGTETASLDDVNAVFDQVAREFTTLQSSGAKLALPPGDYDFELVVRRADGSGAEDAVAFVFRVTDTGAQFLNFR